MKMLSRRAQIRVSPWPVRDATTQAQAIVEQAQSHAAQLLKDAQQEATALREQAVQQGLKDGREQSVASYAGALQKALIAEQLNEQTIVSLAMDVARTVLDRESYLDKQMIRDIARKALSRVRRAQTIVLHVHHEDEAVARASLRDWLAAGAEPSVLDVIVDPNVARGSVIVECELGWIDATLDTQLAAVVRVLEEQR